MRIALAEAAAAQHKTNEKKKKENQKCEDDEGGRCGRGGKELPNSTIK